ncbi:MAG: hypothetical protein VW239_05915, partial [Candidatus Nanopelagicales bacterium]
MKEIDFALFPIDLSKDAKLKTDGDSRPSWLDSVDLSRAEAVRQWKKDTKDDGTHKPGSDSPWLEDDLAPGAYVLRAKG